MKKIDTVIECLKDSPLFYLFLSSRELFHTNFWIWLSTLNKDETLKLFSCKQPPTNISFKREHNQSMGGYKSKVDLLIFSNGQPWLIIENKVKDFPSIDQLTRIKNSFDNADIEYIITSLFYSKDILFKGWHIKTYKEISEKINPASFTKNPYFINLIHDYKSFTFNLSELSSLLDVSLMYDFAISWNWDLYLKLNDIKLWEGYQKLRASHLLNKFKEIYTDVLVDYNINNQKATIGFSIKLQNDYYIGIQLEDVQFRKFVAGKNAELFAKNLIQSNLFFGNTFLGRGNKAFLNYGSIFKYQYIKMDKPHSYEELFKKINNELKEIINNKNKIILNIPN